MKRRKNSIAHLAILVASLTFVIHAQESNDSELYKTIVELDSIYFNAYNSCDMEQQGKMYAKDIEFYHDMGGLQTSKEDLLGSIEENICGKVTRQLVKGSVEVHPINNFGAIEIGLHKFYNNQEPNEESKPSKFIIIWKQNEAQWQISRVVSLH
ncbi:nuclear transport factor 2 family protein [Flagellimonas sp. S3867]|uniref:nuclear transport factor 2 family protein n=1 Tax=Flagellimonas sp. S3867 TaxID=2768063 RepID=UPI0016867541|nr:nuclear transport factor 2 family protein [Flagellimonas sp. S3867]